jgi:hypothetical protein
LLSASALSGPRAPEIPIQTYKLVPGGFNVGANPTQALALALFIVAFTLLAGALAGGGIIYILGFLVVLGASVALFMKCKPWEHLEE